MESLSRFEEEEPAIVEIVEAKRGQVFDEPFDRKGAADATRHGETRVTADFSRGRAEGGI